MTKGAGRRANWVHVNPLMIAGGVGEKIDFLLGYGPIVGVAEMCTNESGQLCGVLDVNSHDVPPRQLYLSNGHRRPDCARVLDSLREFLTRVFAPSPDK